MYIADYIVNLMQDTSKGNVHMIHPIFAVLGVLPMWALTNWNVDLQALCTILITLNSFDRLLFPSNYSPSTSCREGILYSPYFARTLATLAEFTQYWVWATWVEKDF